MISYRFSMIFLFVVVFHLFFIVFNEFLKQHKISILSGFAFARRQFGAAFCTVAALLVRIQGMVRGRASHSPSSESTATGGSAAGMSGVGYASEARKRLRRMGTAAHSRR